MRRLVRLLFLSFLGLMLLPVLSRDSATRLSGSLPGADADASAVIALELALQATVQITLVAPQIGASGSHPIEGQRRKSSVVLVYNEGLGTAVKVGKRNLIITHDHWSALTSQLLYVVISNYKGEVLTYVEPTVFRHSIIYRDGGSLVFIAPEPVNVAVPVSSQASMVYPGDEVVIVVRGQAPNKIGTTGAVVTMTEFGEKHPTFRLRTADRTLLSAGNSGAGVWHDGMFVGNLWSVIDKQLPVSSLNDTPPVPEPTSICVAAAATVLNELLQESSTRGHQATISDDHP